MFLYLRSYGCCVYMVYTILCCLYSFDSALDDLYSYIQCHVQIKSLSSAIMNLRGDYLQLEAREFNVSYSAICIPLTRRYEMKISHENMLLYGTCEPFICLEMQVFVVFMSSLQVSAHIAGSQVSVSRFKGMQRWSKSNTFVLPMPSLPSQKHKNGGPQGCRISTTPVTSTLSFSASPTPFFSLFCLTHIHSSHGTDAPNWILRCLKKLSTILRWWRHEDAHEFLRASQTNQRKKNQQRPIMEGDDGFPNACRNTLPVLLITILNLKRFGGYLTIVALIKLFHHFNEFYVTQ